MSNLEARVRGIFRRAHRRYGRPQMFAVAPVADWALPAGFAHDRLRDAVTNTVTGAVLENATAYQVGEYLDLVPLGRTADLETLIAAGVVPAGSVDVLILASDSETAKRAHAVEIDGDWYNVREVAHAPVGFAPEGVWARVRLERRS